MWRDVELEPLAGRIAYSLGFQIDAQLVAFLGRALTKQLIDDLGGSNDWQDAVLVAIAEEDVGKRFVESGSGGSVSWFHYSSFDLSRSIEVFISWRYPISLFIGLNANKNIPRVY